MADWNPESYLRYADERSRPFVELLARVPGTPRTVVDLGCGPGHLTGALHHRWPDADVLGVDSSPAMIDRARRDDPGGRYTLADLRTFEPPAPVDLVVSNATLQWVADHRALLPRLTSMVAAGGSFAFSVPGNHDAPSHVTLREVAGREPYRASTASVARPRGFDPEQYLDDLARPGWRVDAWETTYVHVLQGEDPVFTWIAATGARPVLDALPEALRPSFVADLQEALRTAYPAHPYGTPLAFRRFFAVATRV